MEGCGWFSHCLGGGGGGYGGCGVLRMRVVEYVDEGELGGGVMWKVRLIFF